MPSRGAVVAVLRRVADQWIGAHTDPGDNGWANATFFSGLLALQRLTGSPRYLAYARNWAEKHAYGLNGGVTTRHADNHNAGQAYLDLYEIEPEESKISAIEESLHRMVYTDQPDKNDDWWWDDALHMAMPPFARIGVLRGDPRYCTTPTRGSGIGTSGSCPGSPAGSSRPRANRWSGRAATAGWRADTPRRSRRCHPLSGTPLSTATPWYVW
jgi:hypothetical protein